MLPHALSYEPNRRFFQFFNDVTVSLSFSKKFQNYTFYLLTSTYQCFNRSSETQPLPNDEILLV